MLNETSNANAVVTKQEKLLDASDKKKETIRLLLKCLLMLFHLLEANANIFICVHSTLYSICILISWLWSLYVCVCVYYVEKERIRSYDLKAFGFNFLFFRFGVIVFLSFVVHIKQCVRCADVNIVDFVRVNTLEIWFLLYVIVHML